MFIFLCFAIAVKQIPAKVEVEPTSRRNLVNVKMVSPLKEAIYTQRTQILLIVLMMNMMTKITKKMVLMMTIITKMMLLLVSCSW